MTRIVQQTLHRASIQSGTQNCWSTSSEFRTPLCTCIWHTMEIVWKKNHKKENHWLQSFLSVAIGQVSDIWRSAGPIYYLLMLQWIAKNCNVRLSDRNILFGLEFSFRMCSLNHKSQTYILWVGILYEHLWKYPQHFRNTNVVVFKNKGNGENACVSIRSYHKLIIASSSLEKLKAKYLHFAPIFMMHV